MKHSDAYCQDCGKQGLRRSVENNNAVWCTTCYWFTSVDSGFEPEETAKCCKADPNYPWKEN